MPFQLTRDSRASITNHACMLLAILFNYVTAIVPLQHLASVSACLFAAYYILRGESEHSGTLHQSLAKYDLWTTQ